MLWSFLLVAVRCGRLLFFSSHRIGNYSSTNYRKIWVWVSAHCQSHQGSLFCFCSTTIFMARFCLGGADVMTCPLLLLNPLKVHFLSIFWSLVVLLYSFCNILLWKDWRDFNARVFATLSLSIYSNLRNVPFRRPHDTTLQIPKVCFNKKMGDI